MYIGATVFGNLESRWEGLSSALRDDLPDVAWTSAEAGFPQQAISLISCSNAAAMNCYYCHCPLFCRRQRHHRDIDGSSG